MPFEDVMRTARSRPLAGFGPATRSLSLGPEDLHRLLPHRDPFLLLDAVDRFDPEGRHASATRRIDPGDPVFRGHFPGAPVYPGVLLLEMMGQLGLCLNALLQRESDPEAGPASLRLVKIHGAVFPGEVRPGDTLTLLAHVIEPGDYTVPCVSQVVCGAEVRAAAVQEVLYMDAAAC